MELSNDHLLLHFTRNGLFTEEGGKELLVLDRGEGVYVYDTNGRRYIDGLSSLFCSQLGYSYGAEFAEVVSDQMGRLAFNTNWGTAHRPAIELAERITDLAPEGIERAFFTSGGSESVEAAWKLVRQYHVANGQPQRTKVIARQVAYHGVTLGALSFTGVPGFKDPFGTPAVETLRVSNTNSFRDQRSEADLCAALLAEIETAIDEAGPETVAMIIAEPIQNAGGCLTPPDGYFDGIRKICDRHGILMVCDEVISGCGRLGEWFASKRYGAEPDVITIAKGLTSAYLPMGAVLANAKVTDHLYEGKSTLLHGITFGGHPSSARVALRNIEIFERDDVLENVRRHEAHLEQRMEELRELPIVGDIRGEGFFWAAEMVADLEDTRFDADQREHLLRGFVPGRLLEAGLIARGDDRGDSVIQIAPPLICDTSQLDEIVDALGEVLQAAGEEMGVTESRVAAEAV